MASNWTIARTRRLSCVFLLVVGLVLPLILRFFLTEEPSALYNHREGQGRSDDHNIRSPSRKFDGLIFNGYVQSHDETARSSILSMMIGHDDFTMMKDDHYLSNILRVTELFEHQIIRKRSIHAIVTTIVALIVTFSVFLCAHVSNRKPQRIYRNNRRMRRRERIIQVLKEYRIRLPTIKNNPCNHRPTTDKDRDDVVECPICLSDFAVGDIVIVSNHCHCNTATNCDRISATGKNHRHHRIYFHEQCIATWLSQRRTNPKKLCPCCRQPFLSSASQ